MISLYRGVEKFLYSTDFHELHKDESSNRLIVSQLEVFSEQLIISEEDLVDIDRIISMSQVKIMTPISGQKRKKLQLNVFGQLFLQTSYSVFVHFDDNIDSDSNYAEIIFRENLELILSNVICLASMKREMFSVLVSLRDHSANSDRSPYSGNSDHSPYSNNSDHSPYSLWCLQYDPEYSESSSGFIYQNVSQLFNPHTIRAMTETDYGILMITDTDTVITGIFNDQDNPRNLQYQKFPYFFDTSLINSFSSKQYLNYTFYDTHSLTMFRRIVELGNNVIGLLEDGTMIFPPVGEINYGPPIFQDIQVTPDSHIIGKAIDGHFYMIDSLLPVRKSLLNIPPDLTFDPVLPITGKSAMKI